MVLAEGAVSKGGSQDEERHIEGRGDRRSARHIHGSPRLPSPPLPAKGRPAGAMNVASAPAIATPSMCRSSSCEPPFDTAPSARTIRPPPERQFAFARCRLPHQQYYAGTSDRVSDERCTQRAASARLAPLPAGQLRLFSMSRPPAPREDQPAQLPGGHAAGLVTG